MLVSVLMIDMGATPQNASVKITLETGNPLSRTPG